MKISVFKSQHSLGGDNMFKFLFANEVSDSLYTLPSKLGTVAGNVPCNNNYVVTFVLRVATFAPESNLNDELKQLWELDQILFAETEIYNDE